ncbi:uncharacterized protein E0L32_004062 [Thyridium curvatum]|uniref:Uncharacterized protein n=1 Tax=Thyridium curvatum TaxID=1093900 RepID=A0A507B8B4_9PEZI|nr:uncharacterized protein E0L32_004062 [Thyridium curvatum]TPX16067.1 hypothetical protein E0L32_004062 [Thyridium curvatum]
MKKSNAIEYHQDHRLERRSTTSIYDSKGSPASPKATGLDPPFSPYNNITEYSSLVFPVAVQDEGTRNLYRPEQDMRRFLSAELRTHKLDQLHRHLWLAGLPLPARPLQRQRMMGRSIFLTERPDEHLVWHQTKLLLKPLPAFLLCHTFWTEHLCGDLGLHRSAMGLLLSYAWLVGHESDFALAQQSGLLPEDVSWPRWTALMRDFVHPDNLDLGSLRQVDRRYHYGELRLSRLDSLVRFLPAMWTRRRFVGGYLSRSTWYQAFFERNFSWLLAAFVFVSVILSALQVGLGTRSLGASEAFNGLSSGLVLMAMGAAFLGIGAVWAVWFSLLCYHVLSTRCLDKSVRRAREQTVDETR